MPTQDAIIGIFQDTGRGDDLVQLKNSGGSVIFNVDKQGTINSSNINVSGMAKMQRSSTGFGSALTAANFALSAGFGSTASIGSITGTDQAFQATITVAGTGQAANPTVTLTFHDGAWAAAPIYVVSRGGGSQPTVQFSVTSVTATALTLTFNGTPVAADTYTFSCIGMGIS
jgi:hypothetical protein